MRGLLALCCMLAAGVGSAVSYTAVPPTLFSSFQEREGFLCFLFVI